MKHAFLEIVHNAPVLLERITSQIDGDTHYIYLNIDKKAELEVFSSVLSEKCYNDIVFPFLAELNIVYNSIRYIYWCLKIEVKSLPVVLNESYFDSIADTRCLFCRKLNEGDTDFLLEKHGEFIQPVNTVVN